MVANISRSIPVTTMVDDLPGAPVIDQRGDIERLGSSSLFMTLVLPLANIVGLGWYFLG